MSGLVSNSRMSRQDEHDFWEEFIEMYKARPVLWKCGSQEYKDRRGKKLAYMELLQKLKEVEPRANVDMVKRKINSLRACYRREVVKMRNSKRNGTSRNTQWRYFDQFSFLRGQKKDPLGDRYEELLKDENLEQDDIDDVVEEEAFEYVAPKTNKRIIVPADSTPSPPPRRDETVDTSYRQLKQENDEADILGISWAYQYRNLTREQKLFAKKAIDDILFEARLETLHRNSVKINEASTCGNCSNTQYIEETPPLQIADKNTFM